MQVATERLILRELVESDAEAIYRIESQPDVARYQSRDLASLEEAQQYVAGSIAAGALLPRRVYDLAITLGGRMIGRCGMAREEGEPRQAMVWYVLDPACHGHGYATEAARALIDFAFDELGVHRMAADVDPRNLPSVRVCERLGMRREAHLVENVWIRGAWCDSAIYAVLKREWRRP